MSESKWGAFKMKEKYSFISIYEVLLFIGGLEIFFFSFLEKYKFVFILSVILIYWFLIRYVESKIHEKKQEIYNVYYSNCKPIPQTFIDKKTEKDREPMYYELEQLEQKRKFLIDKLVVVNLILIILFQYVTNS
ncbi:MAG: hypothetical protein H8E98_00610 [Bacteroidetes bacterium]|nr:hypothetical protein [Bacteroidota bacterium]